MANPARLSLVAALLASTAGCMVHHVPSSPPPGAQIPIQHGRIVGAELVQRPSAAGEGAMVGGFLGFLLSGRSLPEKVLGAMWGAAAGSAVAEANAGPRQAWVYTVQLLDGRSERVMTERPDLRQGDCVAVESARYVNLRRVADALCDLPPPAAAPVEPSIEQGSQEDAARCAEAKEALTQAKTKEETEIAIRRVRVLCDM
jgi:hypothetical protein